MNLTEYMLTYYIYTFFKKKTTRALLCKGWEECQSLSSVVLPKDVVNDSLNMQTASEHQTKQSLQREDQQGNSTCDCTKVEETLACEQQTGQLVKEVRLYLHFHHNNKNTHDIFSYASNQKVESNLYRYKSLICGLHF